MTENLDKYKSRLLIRDVATYLGYKMDISKGKGRSVVMVNDMGERIVLTSRDDYSANRYFNPDNDSDKGDLISFINNRVENFRGSFSWKEPLNRTKYNMAAITAILVGLTGISPEIFIPKNYQPEQKASAAFNNDNYTVKPLDDNGRRFLTITRGLNNKTVDDFEPFIKMVSRKDAKNKMFNVSFPYTIPGNTDIVNYEMRGVNFKSHAPGGNKTCGAWIASFQSKKVDVNNLFLFESAIDAMSFYEIYEKNTDFKNSVFVSLGGSVANEQILALKKAYPYAWFNLCYDNDFAGKTYEIKTAVLLSNGKVDKEVLSDVVKFSLNGKTYAFDKTDLNYRLFMIMFKQKHVNIRFHKPDTNTKVIDENNVTRLVELKDYNDVLRFKKADNTGRLKMYRDLMEKAQKAKETKFKQMQRDRINKRTNIK